MKKRNRLLRVSAAIFSAIFLCTGISAYAVDDGVSVPVPQSNADPIVIYHTNDMHGSLLPVNGISMGIGRVAALKKTTPNSLLIDAGDATQGLPLASLTKGADIIKLMNTTGYDLMAAGNHDFDYGYQTTLENADNADFPILAANVEKEGNLLFKGHNAQNNGCHKVFEVNGVKIGFFGLTTRETLTATNPTGIADLEFKDEVETAKREITELEREGAEIIIAVAHLGEYDSAPCTSKALANAMNGPYQDRLDAIIDGHSHTHENVKINGVLIGQTGTSLTRIGKIVITPSKNSGYDLKETLLTYADVKAIGPDPDVSNALNAITAEQDKLLTERVCETSNALWGGNVNGVSIARFTETNLGNLTADAFLDSAEGVIANSKSPGLAPYKSAPVVAVESESSIRASIPNGVTTKGHLLTAFPFSSTLMMKVITPKTLHEIMEKSLSYITAQDAGTGMLTGRDNREFLQIGGFQVTYDPNAAGSKIKEMHLKDGTTLSSTDDATKIILVSNNFIMSGGYNYSMLENLPLLAEIGGEAETVEGYINKLTQNGSSVLAVPLSDNRIVPKSNYSGTEYTATVQIVTSNNEAAANQAVNVTIDGQTTKTRYTDENGLLRITLPSGPHTIQTGAGQPQMYVNNYTGNGLNSPYPASGYNEQEAASDTIRFTAPSAEEAVIASGRSFYVKGTFSNLGTIPDGTRVSVRLEDSTGSPVRQVSTDIKDNKTLKDNLITFKTDETNIAATGMPDLIWDGTDEASVKNGDIKCYYNDHGFAALIPGGMAAHSVDDTLGLVDKNGNPYPPLADGLYTMHATVSTPEGEILGYTAGKLTIGNTENKILARFSGTDHIKKFQAFAAANGYRIYHDAFPGYWSMDNGWFCEIAPEWRAADASEYATGNVHFIIYNVKKSSAAYSVELGLLQSMGDIGARLKNYYYSTGEPGVIGGTDSQILKFDDGDKLQLVRAEISSGEEKDGIHTEQTAAEPEYDMDLSDGIEAKAGQYVSIYGVAAPIQADASDIQANSDNTYTINNKIQTIAYEITGNGKKQTYEKEVLLERQINGSKTISELEFKHVLPVDSGMAGKTYTVSLEGYDSHEQAVKGTKETFSLTVEKDTPASSEDPGKEPEKEPGKEPEKEPGKEPEKEPGKEPEKKPEKESTPPAKTEGKEETKPNTSAANTGDDTPIALLAVLCGTAICSGALVIRKKRGLRK